MVFGSFWEFFRRVLKVFKERFGLFYFFAVCFIYFSVWLGVFGLDLVEFEWKYC